MSAEFLSKVLLTSGVYASCLQHALTTEKEEVMGLLIGSIDEEDGVSNISACVILHRSDTRPDRVEISPEQLCSASEYAEKLSKKLQKPMRVVGWYHSHPHITVWPSHIDLRTQMAYQTMDPLFVGLIFAVYQNESTSTGNHNQVTCFQAMRASTEFQRREVALEILSGPSFQYNLESITNLPKILSQEEGQRHEGEGDAFEDKLAQLHNNATRTLSLVDIVSKVSKPLVEDLEARLQAVKARIRALEEDE